MTAVNRLDVILNHFHGVSNYSRKSTSSSKYFYTFDNNVLTDEQRAFYEENGYLVIRNMVDHKLLDECKNRFVDISNGTIKRKEIIIMREKSLLNTDAKGEHLVSKPRIKSTTSGIFNPVLANIKMQDIFHDDVLSKYMTCPEILKYAKCFTGPDITGFNSMIINKPPTNAIPTAVHPLHQDLYYFPIRPAERVVACWTAMEKTTVDNGCLFVVPGSHKSHLYSHEYPDYEVNYMYYEAKGCPSGPRVHLEMEKGDTVFFHSLLCHGSGPNMTKGFRKAIACHYASNDCYYVKRDVGHSNVEMALKKAAKVKGLDVTDMELFKLRQTLIQGKPGRLYQV